MIIVVKKFLSIGEISVEKFKDPALERVMERGTTQDII